MERAGAHSRTAWTTEDGGNVRAPTITTLGRVVGQQIEPGGDEIDKLKLGDGLHSHQSRAAGSANDRRLGNRRVNHAAVTELIDEPVSYLKRAAISADVFADHKHSRVAF